MIDIVNSLRYYMIYHTAALIPSGGGTGPMKPGNRLPCGTVLT